LQPTLQQQKDFLFQTYFGTRGDELDRFISRAYRDMNRTLRGIRKLPEEDKARILKGAKNLVKAGINDLSNKSFPANPTLVSREFDQWHTDLCRALKTYYSTELQNLQSEIRLTYGQAQKWVNMTMKYCWVCGNADVAGLDPWYSVAHVAVDEVILVAAEKSGVVKIRPCGRWSTWDDQQAYKDFQNTLRQTADKQPQSPLELEYGWWLKYRSQVTGDGVED
jgi:hypothetical protein